MTSGDEEAPLMYIMLAKKHPEHNFYLIGRSDIQRFKKKNSATLSGFFGDEDEDDSLPDNIIDLFEGWNRKEFPGVHLHDWVYEKIQNENLKFDLGLIYYGPMPQVGIPGKGMMRLDGKGEAKTLEMFSAYYAPIMNVLNAENVPWIGFCGDPKFVPSKARDMINEPKIVLSQTSGTFSKKLIKSYEESLELKRVNEEHTYAGIETIFMLEENLIDWRNVDKDILFTIGLNGGASRDTFIREWFLDKDRTDIKVYGKWDEEFTTKYPDMFEEKRISEVADEFYRTKYTIIPPPHLPTGNFVTQKFWKMLMYGIIPFFHPGYDTEKILPFQNDLRVKSPADMWDKIKYLEENPSERKLIQNKLWTLINNDGLFDGSQLHNIVKSHVKKYTQIEL